MIRIAKFKLILGKLSQVVFRYGYILVLQSIVKPLKDCGSGFIRIAKFLLILVKLSSLHIIEEYAEF